MNVKFKCIFENQPGGKYLKTSNPIEGESLKENPSGGLRSRSADAEPGKYKVNAESPPKNKYAKGVAWT